jgi:hypothetical protein
VVEIYARSERFRRKIKFAFWIFNILAMARSSMNVELKKFWDFMHAAALSENSVVVRNETNFDSYDFVTSLGSTA